MARSYNFAIVQLAAHPARDERLNVGLIVFHDDHLDIHIAKSLDKVRAISGALDAQVLREAIGRLAEADSYAREIGDSEPTARLNCLKTLSPVGLSPLGTFSSHSSAAYADAVANLLTRLVEPEPTLLRKAARRSNLLSEMKAAFRHERVLAKKGEDLGSHRVIAGMSLAHGLSADLVLKNGAMHVIETVDAAGHEVSIRKIVSDIAVSALVFEQARMLFGQECTKSRLVYDASASTESIAKPSLLAAEHQGAELVNWASAGDRAKLITLITSLATPIENPKNRRVGSWVNASRQSNRLLN